MPRQSGSTPALPSRAHSVDYDPATPGDYSVAPDNVGDALDDIASQVAGGGVTEIGKTGDKIAGSVELIEGTNITITRAAQAFTIDASGGVGGIDDLTDATIDGTPADNELLAFDSTSGLWVNQTPAEANVCDLSTSQSLSNKTIVSGAFTGSFAIPASISLANGSAVNVLLITNPSGVNYLTIANSATVGPSLTAAGTGTNLDLRLISKGTGLVTANGINVQPLTTEGDIQYRGASDNTRLAKGTAGQVLTMNSGATAPEWAELSARFRQRSFVGYLENPIAGDTFPIGYCKDAVTLTEIKAETDTGTCTLNVEKRAYGAAEDAGTDTMSSDLVAADGGATGTITAGAVSAGTWLTVTVTSVATSPTGVWVTVTGTID